MRMPLSQPVAGWRLDVEAIVVKRDFARDGDAALVRTQIVTAGRKAERVGKRFEALAPV